MNAKLTEDGRTIIIRIPMNFRRQGSRKRIIIPEGFENFGLPRSARNEALIQALARGFQWRKLLENGDAVSVKDLATSEKIDPSYMARLLRMTLLAPDIIEAILAGQQPDRINMGALIGSFPDSWEKQRELFGFPKMA